MSGLAGENLRHRHAFVLRLVRQHRSRDNVADGIDAGHAGGEVRIDDDAPFVVLSDTDGFEAESFGKRNAADRDEHDVGFDLIGRAARHRLDPCPEPVPRRFHRGHLRRKSELYSLPLENAAELSADLVVHPRQDAVEEFHDDDFRAEPPPDRADFEADHAGADHKQPLRYALE